MGKIAAWMGKVNEAVGADGELSEREKAGFSKEMGLDVIRLIDYGASMARYEAHSNTMPFQSPEDRLAWQEDKQMYYDSMAVTRDVAEGAIESLDKLADIYGLDTLQVECGARSLEGLGSMAASEFSTDYASRSERLAEIQSQVDAEAEKAKADLELE